MGLRKCEKDVFKGKPMEKNSCDKKPGVLTKKLKDNIYIATKMLQQTMLNTLGEIRHSIS